MHAAERVIEPSERQPRSIVSNRLGVLLATALTVTGLPACSAGAGGPGASPVLEDDTAPGELDPGSDPDEDPGLDPGEEGGGGPGGTPTELRCATNQQELLILDFRSGWWSGGGGGSFYEVALGAVHATCPNIAIEYHHFEVDFDLKCTYAPAGSGQCTQLDISAEELTSADVVGLFDKAGWNDYTQVWILSGSLLDAADVSLTGELFHHFLAETGGSCVPALIGAGDGFIDHGNSVSAELGLGGAFATSLLQPGFFQVATIPGMPPLPVTVESRMSAGTELQPHLLFSNVESIADQVSNMMGQTAAGDSIQQTPALSIIAHDSQQKPAIAVGVLNAGGADERPFILDAGFQRYYAVGDDVGTRTLLENMVLYLGLVGCKAETPK